MANFIIILNCSEFWKLFCECRSHLFRLISLVKNVQKAPKVIFYLLQEAVVHIHNVLLSY